MGAVLVWTGRINIRLKPTQFGGNALSAYFAPILYSHPFRFRKGRRGVATSLHNKNVCCYCHIFYYLGNQDSSRWQRNGLPLPSVFLLLQCACPSPSTRFFPTKEPLSLKPAGTTTLHTKGRGTRGPCFLFHFSTEKKKTLISNKFQGRRTKKIGWTIIIEERTHTHFQARLGQTHTKNLVRWECVGLGKRPYSGDFKDQTRQYSLLITYYLSDIQKTILGNEYNSCQQCTLNMMIIVKEWPTVYSWARLYEPGWHQSSNGGGATWHTESKRRWKN